MAQGNMDSKKIGAFMAELREKRGLDEAALAERVGCSAQDISMWEAGVRFPSLRLVPKLAQELQVSVDELLRGERDEPVINIINPVREKPPAEPPASERKPFPVRAAVLAAAGVTAAAVLAVLLLKFFGVF